MILSDGDVVFQPRKVERAGLRELFGGRILIYIHKERNWARSPVAIRRTTTC